MVKFGRHCQAFEEENEGKHVYIVPYNSIRNVYIENVDSKSEDPEKTQRRFEAAWRESLGLATSDFGRAMIELWKIVFDGISVVEEGRGALPDTALRLYLCNSTLEAAQELLDLAKRIHNTALTNAEALRKLVKKFDKQHGAKTTAALLPEVYAANFNVGLSTLQAGLNLLRASLGMDDDETGGSGAEEYAQAQDGLGAEGHDSVVARRKDEIVWLKRLVGSIAPTEIKHIVAHRGFHSPMDRSDCRPLENSLSAYEAAWTSGVHLCECDIALTKDEKLILAHDEDFSRLALDPSSPMSSQKVGDLTLRELISLPLKSGIRPPLLIDVLRSAQAIGGNAQLIIEIKPGNVPAASALARMFIRHPDLMRRCAVVMSFDAFAMHTLRRDLRVLRQSPVKQIAGTVSLPTAMSLGQLGMRVDSFDAEPVPAEDEQGAALFGHKRIDSADHFGVGLESLPGRTDSFTFSPFNQYSTSPQHPAGTKPPLSTSPSSTGMKPPLSTSPSGSGMKPPLSTSASRISSISAGSMQAPSERKAIPVPPSTSSHHPHPLIPPATPTSPNISPGYYMMKQNLASPSERKDIPKLMLLTVADKPKIPCELRVQVLDLSPVDHWLHTGDGSLDGVYLQFEKQMLDPDGASALRKFADRYAIGVWGINGKDPDTWESFHHLVREAMVSYVNSDLPREFRKGPLTHRGVSFGESSSKRQIWQ